MVIQYPKLKKIILIVKKIIFMVKLIKKTNTIMIPTIFITVDIGKLEIS